jgi:hypothetical protein
MDVSKVNDGVLPEVTGWHMFVLSPHVSLQPYSWYLSHLDHDVGCLECSQIILHGRESHVSSHPVCRMTIVVTIDEGAFLEVEMGSTSGQVPGNGLADHFWSC